jgi:hypothetical protein
MILDSGFLLYAISEKEQQATVARDDTQLRREIKILKRRLRENENLHRLPGVPDTQHEATRLLSHRV